jgi:hypothetical protein
MGEHRPNNQSIKRLNLGIKQILVSLLGLNILNVRNLSTFLAQSMPWAVVSWRNTMAFAPWAFAAVGRCC